MLTSGRRRRKVVKSAEKRLRGPQLRVREENGFNKLKGHEALSAGELLTGAFKAGLLNLARIGITSNLRKAKERG